MSDIIDKIMAELESDPLIQVKSLNLVVDTRGFLNRRKVLSVFGTAETSGEKDRALKIVQKQAGEKYEVADKIVVIGE